MISLLSLPMFIAGAVSFIFFLFFTSIIPMINKSDMDNRKFFASYRIFLVLSLLTSIYCISFGIMLNSGNNLFYLNITNRLVVIMPMFCMVVYLHLINRFFNLKCRNLILVFYGVNVLFSVFAVIDSSMFLHTVFFNSNSYYTGMKYGIFFYIWAVYFFIIIITTGIFVFIGYKQIRRNENVNALAVIFMLIFSFLWLAGALADLLTAVGIIDLPPLSWICTIVIVMTTAFVLIVTIEKLGYKVQDLYMELIHDNLTKAYSKSFLEISFHGVYNNLGRTDSRNFLVLFDVDDFKLINDMYGHLFGDCLLKELITIVKNRLRVNDIVARFGGDEFIILIKDCDINVDIVAMIDRLREFIASHLFEIHRKKTFITCSFGIAEFDRKTYSENRTYDEIFAAADQVLYKSKEMGKNRVTFHKDITA